MGLNVTDVEMTAYDALPAEIREVLREAPELWSAAQTLMLWDRNRARGATLDQFVPWLRLHVGITKQKAL